MGNCLRKGQESDAVRLESVVAHNYTPPDHNASGQLPRAADTNLHHTQQTNAKPKLVDHHSDNTSPKDSNGFKHKLAPIQTNHIKLNLANGIQLNHYSPFPGAFNRHSHVTDNNKRQSLQSLDSLQKAPHLGIKIGSHSDNALHSPSFPIISPSNMNARSSMTPSSGSLHTNDNDEPVTVIDDNNDEQTERKLHDEEKTKLYVKQTDFASGAFAHVFVCDAVNGKKVAIKKIDVYKDDAADALYQKLSGKTAVKDADAEFEILTHLNQSKYGQHTNIINLVDGFYETTAYNDIYLYLVMDFIDSSLDKEIVKYANDEATGTLPATLIQIYAFQILNALRFLKMNKVLHRDLKPENILIDTRCNVVKICDYGCSRILNEDDSYDGKLENYVCSRYYRAPELIVEAAQYDYAIDMWSFGCILAEMFLGQIIFDGDDTVSQLNVIMKMLGVPTRDELNEMNEHYEYDKMLEKFDCDTDEEQKLRDWQFLFIGIDGVTDELIELLDSVLVYAPKDRITAADAMKHEFFEQIVVLDDGDEDDDEREEILNKYNVPKHVISI